MHLWNFHYQNKEHIYCLQRFVLCHFWIKNFLPFSLFGTEKWFHNFPCNSILFKRVLIEQMARFSWRLLDVSRARSSNALSSAMSWTPQLPSFLLLCKSYCSCSFLLLFSFSPSLPLSLPILPHPEIFPPPYALLTSHPHFCCPLPIYPHSASLFPEQMDTPFPVFYTIRTIDAHISLKKGDFRYHTSQKQRFLTSFWTSGIILCIQFCNELHLLHFISYTSHYAQSYLIPNS